MLRNTFLYYFLAFTPLLILVFFVKAGYISAFYFMIGLFLYVPYRMFLDGARLKAKGILKGENFGSTLIPFWRFEYYKELYGN